MKEFNWEEFKKGKIAVHFKTEKEEENFLIKCDKQNIVWGGSKSKASSKNFFNVDLATNSYIKYDIDGILRCINNDKHIILEWSDCFMKTETENKELNIIEVADLPIGSKLYFEINNIIYDVYIDEDTCLRYEDDDIIVGLYKSNLKAKFILISLPPKEVTFKEAVEEYSKGGQRYSELNGVKREYVGKRSMGDGIKTVFTANSGHSLTTDEILNAKWFIVK